MNFGPIPFYQLYHLDQCFSMGRSTHIHCIIIEYLFRPTLLDKHGLWWGGILHGCMLSGVISGVCGHFTHLGSVYDFLIVYKLGAAWGVG